MTLRRKLRFAVASGMALSLVCPPAEALVSLNDGHDHVYVTGSVGFGWDSNVFASSAGRSDYMMNSSLVAEYTRRAGWIGVNANVEVDATRFNSLKGENFNDPKFNAEFTKQTGRTTGSLTLSLARQSRADAAVNMRTTSWNYAAGLNFKYPIITLYTLSGQIGYSAVKYEGNQFPELDTYSASADLIRIFSSERDVNLGYRYRRGNTSADTSFDDNALTLGMSGKIIRGVHGSVRVGYQVRSPHGASITGQPLDSFHAWTASGSSTYAFNKRLSFTGTIAKDFSTTANDISVDSTTLSLDAQYAFSSHWTFSGTVSAGDNRFLGDAGRAVISLGPPLILGASRRDEFVTANASVNYSLNEHLKISGSYNWFKNWSNVAFADFVRSSYNLNLSSRW